VKREILKRPQTRSHPSEDRIEAYVLGRLPGQQKNLEDDPEVVAIEEHLLICPACVEAAESFEETAEGVRLALSLDRPKRQRNPKPKTLAAGQSDY
jgi:hypothetical protein